MDHNTNWGTGRLLLLGIGAVVLVLSAFIQYRERIAISLPAGVRTALGHWDQTLVLQFLWKYRLSVLAGFCTLTILAVYLFFVTAGTWTEWPESTRYYDDQATAFRDGNLYLSVHPPAAFLVLPDPYEPAARNSTADLKAFVDKVYDLSFYNGRFYLYWGPAPAVLLWISKLFYTEPVPDRFLVFGFLAGLLIFTVLLILELWRGFYEDVPFSLALIGIVVAGLAAPLVWMLASAAIYEATIAAGQFFVIGGLYFAHIGLKQPSASGAKLLAATALWALAGASRTLILVPAAFLTFMLVLWVVTNGGQTKPAWKTIQKALPLIIPLAFVGLALGWYNWARFGSMLETGHRYSLTLHNLNSPDAASFSASYALPSLWMYLFSPFETQSRFPFVSATYARAPSFLFFGEMRRYHPEAVTGLLFSVPFILFSVFAVLKTVSSASKAYLRRDVPLNENREQRLLWLLICLLGSALLPFALVLTYFDARMRFLAEFSPSLMLVSVLGLWQGYRSLQGKTVGRFLYVAGAVGLGLFGLSIGVLLTMTEAYSRFRHYSPLLLKQLMLFFAH